MPDLREALILTWDARTIRIRCPFQCDARIHRHGLTLPNEDRVNARAAHCALTFGSDDSTCCRGYRLVFPFEEEQFTSGLWWELDRTRCCWRTIGWGVDDPEYVLHIPPKQSSSQDEDNDSDAESTRSQDTEREVQADMLSALQSLRIEDQQKEQRQDQRQNDEKLLFDSYCITNDIDPARRALQRSNDPRALIDEVADPEGKPVLLMACEEGNSEIVEFLLTQQPLLEARDRDGNTALLTALRYGYGRVARQLVAAGASVDAVNRDRLSLHDIARQALNSQERFYNLELKSDGDEYPATRTRRHARKQEILAIQNIIEECEIREARDFAERERQKLLDIYGERQANQFITINDITRQGIISEMLRRMSATPLSSERKTVGCLTRGTALPYTIAVSGYTSGLFGTRDGALDRLLWLEKAFQLGALLDHTFPVDSYDEAGRPGSYNACHVEKQLLAFAIWAHSTALGRWTNVRS